MKQKINSVVVVVVLLFFMNVSAQEQQIKSLLSNIGLGTTFTEATIAERAQGDLSVVGNNNYESVTFVNPALLSDLQLTSFGGAFQVQSTKVNTQDLTFSNSSTTLSNIIFGVPLGVKGGFALGLRVHSAIGFDVDSESFYNNGYGTVNHIYGGVGYQIFKNFSLGLQANVYFGGITKTQAFKNIQKSTVMEESYNVKGLSTKIGAQYKIKIYKRIIAQLGAYGVLGYNLSASGNSKFYEAFESGNNNFYENTNRTPIASTLSGIQKNEFKSVIGLGLGEVNRWFAGASYESQGATTYSGNVFNQTYSTPLSTSFEPFSKVSIGGYVIPKKYSIKNYLSRVVYRAGFKYENTGTVLNNHTLKNIAMTFGLGLPIGKRVSYANFAVEIGQLGALSQNSYQEEYINLGVSFSLADKWFEKRLIR